MSSLSSSPKSSDASDLVESSSGDEDKQSGKIELRHFAHKHLLLYEDKDVDEDRCCRLCLDYGDGMFGCKKCDFFVHKSCAELPRYIHNFLHPMHPLELGNVDKYQECSLCEKQLIGRGYICSLCEQLQPYQVHNFKLHMNCATKNKFDPKNHQHSFINLKPTLFTCDACGIHEDRKRLSYICSFCQVQVHPTCHEKFPLSRRVRQRMHAHVLKLCYSFQFDFDFSNKSCKICSKKMNNVLCLYQCEKGCNYIAHTTCATSKNHLIEKIDHEKEVELEEIDTEPNEVIANFIYPHSLILSNIEPTYEAGYVCHGCVRPISAPFYTCDSEKCKFFLHKQCSELPKTIQSPIHQHPLVLKDFLDLYMSDTIYREFTCDACLVRCNGFAYQCPEYDCWKKFDVGCTLIGDTLNHASHRCTLTLVSTIPNEENRCDACDSKFSNAFWCERCDFFLDLKCASLPKTIGHDCPTDTEWTVKPLKLRYGCIEHAGGQYYCDLCAETRGKDLWFYHCEDCRDSIHPQCLLGDDRFMYGKSYNMEGHCHTVCVAIKPKNDPLCDNCGEPCLYSPLMFCPTCKVYFHVSLRCWGMMSSSKDKSIRNYCYGISSSPHANDVDDDNCEIAF